MGPPLPPFSLKVIEVFKFSHDKFIINGGSGQMEQSKLISLNDHG
jgi:hypothetical protein